jgi:hypothetical protein
MAHAGEAALSAGSTDAILQYQVASINAHLDAVTKKGHDSMMGR